MTKVLAGVVALAVLTTACGGGEAVPGSPTPPVEQVQLDCETLGYPCDWRDADREVLTRSLDFLDDTAELLSDGQSPESVAKLLETRDGVVATNWAETGVVFRLEGGLPVTAMTELASPIGSPPEAPGTGHSESDQPAIQVLAFNPRQPTAAVLAIDSEPGGSTHEPTRRPDVRPRTAMVLSPTREANFRAAVAASELAGTTRPDSPPTATRDALVASDHFTVLDLPDDEAHPGHWANMAAFDIVVIETHGANYERRPERELSGLFLAGPLAAPYLANLGMTGEEVQFLDFGGFTFARIGIDREFHLTFQDDFFHQLPGSGVGKTIVIVNACRMGEESVATTALASTIAGNRGAVFSWSDALPSAAADGRTALLVSLLADGADAKAAISQMRLDEVDTAEYRGIEAELLLYQEPGVNLRARDTVATFVGGSFAQPGVTIAAKGTPEDGQNDRIEGVEIRVDGVNRGDEETTSIKVTVDGAPLKMIQDGAAVEEAFLSAVTIREAPTAGNWRHHAVNLDQAILPFDLQDEDIALSREHVWEVTVQGAAGGPTIHRVDPVIFRLGTVRIVSPNTGLSLAANDRVGIDGAVNDGEAEKYPLIVRVEHLDATALLEEPALLEEYEVRISVAGQDGTLPLTAFDNLGDGAFRYEADIAVGDVQSTETSMQISAELIHRRTSAGGEEVEVDRFDPSPVVLVVEPEAGPGDATISVGGTSWEFELTTAYGLDACTFSQDKGSVLAAGAVLGDRFGVTFTAQVTTLGSGYITVKDRDSGASWYAMADRDHVTNLHLVPDGQSQIDTITFDGRVISGTATFIDGGAVDKAFFIQGPLPAPVTGSFEIRCPSAP